MANAALTNNKFPKNDVIYNGRYIPGHKDVVIPMDVRQFIWKDDFILKKFLSGINLSGKSNDDKAFEIFMNVKSWLKYVADIESNTYTEFWQFPTETLTLGTGDCECGSILIASLLLNAGIPQYRVKVAAGWVDIGKGQKGGHAYCIYLRETDNEWVPLDWCFLPNNLPVQQRPTLKIDKNYLDIWFTFNNQYSRSDSPLDIYGIEDKQNLETIPPKEIVWNI